MTYSKRSLLAILAFIAFILPAGTAAAADRWVKIYNNTSVTLYRFYASPNRTNKWGRDRLVDRQVPSGYNSTINLNRAPRGCWFDFRAEFIDGDVLEKYHVNVCGGYAITYSD